MPEGIDTERKSLGLSVRTTDDPMGNVTGDSELFKYALITPNEPFTVANYEQEVKTTDDDGNENITKRVSKENVPKLVSTMALGNLNSKEVALARIYTETSRICAWHGYKRLAIEYYLKVVHLNVTSQSHQSQLLRQILTETVSVSRKEESLAGTRDFTGESKDKFGAFIDKWKQKDAEGKATNPNSVNNFGLK